MKNKLLLILIGFAIVFAMLPFFGGGGEKAFAQEDFVEIADTQSFLQIGKTLPLDGNYKLTADLNFEGIDFLPIGLDIAGSQQQIAPFTGNFFGNGHTIDNLHFNQSLEYYDFGLFAHLQNASVTNLKLTNVYINNNVAFSQNTLNFKSIFAGGVAAVAENSVLENLHIGFDQLQKNNLPLAAGTVNFGGLVGRVTAGFVKNVFVDASFNFNVYTNKLDSLNASLLAGQLDNVLVSNSIVNGELAVSQANPEAQHISKLSLGSIAGAATGKNLEIISTYSNIKFNLDYQQTEATNIGALVGRVSNQLHAVPTQNNISYNVMVAKHGQENSFSQVFGDAGVYNKTTSVYNFLSQDNYEVFGLKGAQNIYWPPFENYVWNTNSVWQLKAKSLPQLQMFSNYTVQLEVAETSGVVSSVPAQDLLAMYFYNEQVSLNSMSYRYGELVTIVIAPINDFDFYYSVESVQLNGSTLIALGQQVEGYELVQIDFSQDEQQDDMEKLGAKIIDPYPYPIAIYPLPTIEPWPYPIVIENEFDFLNTSKVYLLSFYATNFNSGKVSVTLSKDTYDLQVETHDPLQGKVRRKEAVNMREQSFTQKVSVENLYEFVAEEASTNFAFDKWVIELEEENGQTSIIELGELGQRQQISFKFGKQDTTPITQNLLKGGKLVAVFTNNVTKIKLVVEERRAGENSEAGQILSEDETQVYPSSSENSFIKNRNVTFVAKEKPGYKFVGWYDSQNILRERSNILVYQHREGEDQVVFSAVFEKVGIGGAISTVWLVVGGILAAGAIVLVVVLVRRRSKDYSYRRFY